VFFFADQLPRDRDQIAGVLLDVMGSPDVRQIDGLGGATSQTSKVAIISRSDRPDTDVDYLFAQVDVARPIVDWGGTCGNLSAAVGAFAVDAGLVRPPEPNGEVSVRIHLVNTGKRIVDRLSVVDGRAALEGDVAIPGVPGRGAPIDVTFIEPGGSQGKGLLPTGRAVDVVEVDGREVEVSLVDAGVPVVFVDMSAVGMPPDVLPAAVDADDALRGRLERVRGEAAVWLGLVPEWSAASSGTPGIPKVCAVGAPRPYTTSEGRRVDGGDFDLAARIMSMQRAHQSFSVTGAIATAAASAIPGTVVERVLASSDPPEGAVRIGQPYGVMTVRPVVGLTPEGPVVESVALQRTARHILDGEVWVRRDRLRQWIVAGGSPIGTERTSDVFDRARATARSCSAPLKQYGATRAFRGRVRTVVCFEDNLNVKRLLESRSDGEVLVIDAGGSLRTAMLGERLAAEAAANGWAGIIVNGAVRNLDSLRAIPLGIKALGASPAPSAKSGLGSVDATVTFGGVVFSPGDMVYSDDDGIVVVAGRDTVMT